MPVASGNIAFNLPLSLSSKYKGTGISSLRQKQLKNAGFAAVVTAFAFNADKFDTSAMIKQLPQDLPFILPAPSTDCLNGSGTIVEFSRCTFEVSKPSSLSVVRSTFAGMFHLVAVAPLNQATFDALLRKIAAEKHMVDVVQLRAAAGIGLKSHHMKTLRDHSVVLEICYPNSSKVDQALDTFYSLADHVFRFSSSGSLAQTKVNCSNIAISTEIDFQDENAILPTASTLIHIATRVGAANDHALGCINGTCWMALRQAENRRRRDGHLSKFHSGSRSP